VRLRRGRFSRWLTRSTPVAEKAFVALGGNVGDVLATFRRALLSLNAHDSQVLAVSSAYRTEALLLPGTTAPMADFWNAVCAVHTTLAPVALLERLQGLEAQAGRVRTSRWGPRCLDLDLLLFGQQTLATPVLTLPHPAMHERAFVLRPLTELEPGITVPPAGQTVGVLLASLPDQGAGILEVRSRWRL
jgi:2-amino-4-hydroxy-6-hydroxymethyldihydropteridine diphosphokinase